ncbi:aromatic amino acid hydroxylase [bacterium]|nr:aromatic amino acid hydroxylase [bacterium]
MSAGGKNHKEVQAIAEIPKHLKPFTTEQDPSLYSWIDHAGWRFIMQLSADYFEERAHPIYRQGLKATGISIERIPLISEMDEALKKFGWRAVNVSGFIPPAAFLEFMELGILPIACEMRKVENLNYTPAPDIVHEAAGHAPILADIEYANYVKSYGKVATKAIFSKKDIQLFEAIRALSDIKEKPSSTEEQIALAQKNFERAYSDLDYVSESTQLARMSWWTIEYGMIGDLNKPVIYGAGLLSSLGESFHTFDKNVKKIPLSQDCIHQAYDITKHQPQLYVAPNIESMKKILEDYANTMAFRVGGSYALGKAKHADTTTTTVIDSGLNITGVVKNFSCDAETDYPSFLNIKGPLQLSLNGKELADWTTKTLPKRILSPMGAPTEFSIDGKSQKDWWNINFNLQKGRLLKATFESGLSIEGKIAEGVSLDGRNLFLNLTGYKYHCCYENKTYELENTLLLFGTIVPSVYGGAGDQPAYLEATEEQVYVSNTHQANYDTAEYQDLISAYKSVRDMREAKTPDSTKLNEIITLLAEQYPKDWLLRWELLEINTKLNLSAPWEEQISSELEGMKTTYPQNKELIDRGLSYLAKLKTQKSAA